MPRIPVILDWLMAAGQPSLLSFGFEPVLGVQDNVLAEAARFDSVLTRGSRKQLEFAARRIARAALGIELLSVERRFRPVDYLIRQRRVVLDHEEVPFRHVLDAESHDFGRIEMIDRLCEYVNTIRDEGARYDRHITIGAYFPITAFMSNMHPSDPNYAPLMQQADYHFAPYIARLDFVTLECSATHDDMKAWKVKTRADIDYTKQRVGNIPVFCEMQLRYEPSWNTPKHLAGQILSPGNFDTMLTWALRQEDLAGVCLFQQDLEYPNSTRPPDNGDGTRQVPYGVIEKYVKLAAERLAEAKHDPVD